jgi:two-component sensor histidine kinase
VKIVKIERDPALFTGKLLIKFQNILRNATQVIIQHRVKIIFSFISSLSYDNLSSVSQNVLKFYQQLTGEERRIPFIFDDFHFCCSRNIGLDMMENRIFTLCRIVIIRHRVNILFSVISSPITLEQQK